MVENFSNDLLVCSTSFLRLEAHDEVVNGKLTSLSIYLPLLQSHLHNI